MAIQFPAMSTNHASSPQSIARRVAPALKGTAPRAATPVLRRPETPLPTSRSATAAGTSGTSAPPSAAVPDPVAAFQALFSGKSSNTPVSATPATNTGAAVPTVESVFGDHPWLDNPTGQYADGTTYGYNQQYFATPETAAIVAKMVGGTVVAKNTITTAPGSPFQQQQPNQMVQLKNGALINAGLVAGFYTHGYPQSMIDQMIANEVANTSA